MTQKAFICISTESNSQRHFLMNLFFIWPNIMFYVRDSARVTDEQFYWAFHYLISIFIWPTINTSKQDFFIFFIINHEHKRMITIKINAQ